jgi:phosphate transport system substrate-binding protein
MLKKLLLCATAAVMTASCGGGDNQSATAQGEQIVLIDGSSTVFPISEALGEEFQRESGTRVTVGLSGTGGGFQKFCRGEIDVAGASRPIRHEEIAMCREAGIEFIELPVALDALATIVSPSNTWADCMTVAELKTIWEPAAQGKIDNWSQVRPGFPDAPLRLFGAGTDSGTFDYYTAAINGKEGDSRGDYTATEDDNVTITGVGGDANAIGYLGLAYVTENVDKVKTISIRQPDGSCVAPSVQAARDASYQPLSRPLFFYVNKARADARPQVQQFLDFAFDPATSETLVGEVGYVPLPTAAYAQAKAKFDARRTGTYFGGESKIGVTMDELLADTAAPSTPSS